MIKITDEMRNMKQKRIEEVCSKVDRQIELAVRANKNYCLFVCDMDADVDVYDEIKKMYQAEGYKIVPYGYSGGVRKRAENIYW